MKSRWNRASRTATSGICFRVEKSLNTDHVTAPLNFKLYTRQRRRLGLSGPLATATVLDVLPFLDYLHRFSWTILNDTHEKQAKKHLQSAVALTCTS